MSDNNTEKRFIELIGELARADMKKRGVLASVTIAQACLESGYGTTELAEKANNLFGMKCSLSGNTWTSVWDGKSKYVKTTAEQREDGSVYHIEAAFRKYKYIADSIADHSLYLIGAMNGNVKRYSGLAGEKDYKKAAQIIKNGGYATDINYVSKLRSLIERYNLTQYDNVEYEGGKEPMKVFLCVGHADYGGGIISSADGTKYGGVNEYKYNKALAPYVKKWLEKGGCKVTMCVAPEGKLHSLNDEINYFIGLENAGNYDLSVQLHLNAFNSSAYGCEAYAYNDAGLKVADSICKKLGTVWHNRGPQIKTGLYWTRKTRAKAVLIESFFCDNKSDYEKAKTLGFDAHGKLIAEGILGKNITENAGSGASVGVSGEVKYTVQCGAFSVKENAEALREKLKKAGFDAFVKSV